MLNKRKKMDSRTRNQNSEVLSEINEEETLKESIKTYLLDPLSAGLAGFAVFFSIILVTKFFGFIIGSYDSFTPVVGDVVLSLVGFLFVTGEKFLEFFVKED
jgi:hypothetical protein